MNNLNLAERMFMNALELCPTDPLVCNELGVFAYRSGDYSKAVAWLRRAQDLVPGGRPTAGGFWGDILIAFSVDGCCAAATS